VALVADARANGSSPARRARARRSEPGTFLSPVVRRLAEDYRLDPAGIRGSGTGGRVTREDVLAVINAAVWAAPPTGVAPAPETAETAPEASPPTPSRAAEDEIVELNRIQRLTGEHMVHSLATSPHALSIVEADFDRVDRVRKAVGLTYLPFVARAVVDALADYPHVNASVGDGELVVHHAVHLDIAVDLDHRGLVVPVVRDAHTKQLPTLAAEIGDLAARARAKRLTPDDVAGGTFTITNPGPYGTLLSAPIIHQPQVAILSTDGVRRRPVVLELDDGGETIAIHTVGMLALSWDHRAFDGAYASAFLARVREIVERRAWDAEL
jgi:2-oxoglutarate dehydrogenase E2 component (dihydrolipoamide succinyltransferase)